jgi:hypothetical protein
MVRMSMSGMVVQTALVKIFGRDLFMWITPWVSSRSSIQFMLAMEPPGCI